MTEEQKADQEMLQEIEVVELESDDGELESFIVLDRIEIKGQNYALMALLEDFDNMEAMDEQEFQETYGEESIFFLMREENETFIEIAEKEFNEIKEDLNKKLQELHEAEGGE